MTDTPQRLAGKLLEEGEKTQAFFQSLTEGQWQMSVYADGALWTPRQVLAHFVSTEGQIHSLIENLLAGGSGAPEGFDVDAFNAQDVPRWDSFSTSELQDQLQRLREKTAALVQSLAVEDLSRQGRHPFLGVASLEDILKLLYRHQQIHLRDIRRVIHTPQAANG
jgi:hypothetical protein